MRNFIVGSALFFFVFFSNYVLSSEVYLRKLQEGENVMRKKEGENVMKKKEEESSNAAKENEINKKVDYVHEENNEKKGEEGADRKEAELIYKARFVNSLKNAIVRKKNAKLDAADYGIEKIRRATQLLQEGLDRLTGRLVTVCDKQIDDDLLSECDDSNSNKEKPMKVYETQKNGNSDQNDSLDKIQEGDNSLQNFDDVQASFDNLNKKIEDLLKKYDELADKKLSDLDDAEKNDLFNIQKEIQALLELIKESLEADLTLLSDFVRKLDFNIDILPKKILQTVTELVGNIQQGSVIE